MLERDYQADLIKTLREIFDGCIILKNDTDYQQGIPDLLILYGDRWAALEVKTSRTAKDQPNQAYYIMLMHEMSYAAYIYPEVEAEVLDELQQTLRPRRSTRFP